MAMVACLMSSRLHRTLLGLLVSATVGLGTVGVTAVARAATRTHIAAASSKTSSHSTSPKHSPIISHGTVSILKVPSADADLPVREVYVYRPAAAVLAASVASQPLPVLYMLHGYPGHPGSLMRAMAPALDQAFADGVRPFVVAMPDGNGKAHPDTEWADSVDRRTLVETSLLKKVIPAVEGSVPLEPGMRAIGGFSMGGYGAANLALRNPRLFSQVVVISGYFHIDDPSGMFGRRRAVIAANTPDDMVSRAAGQRWALIDAAGESDPLMIGQETEFAQRLRKCHCAADVGHWTGSGTHGTAFVAAETRSIAEFLARGWRQPS